MKNTRLTILVASVIAGAAACTSIGDNVVDEADVGDGKADSALPNANRLTAAELKTAFAGDAKDALFLSESEFAPEFASVDFAGKRLSVANVKRALGPAVVAYFAKESTSIALADMAVEMSSAQQTRTFLTDLATPNPDDAPDASAAAWGRIKARLDQNLTNVRAFKMGDKDEHGALTVDQGFYVWLVVGKTKDGKLAGFMVGTVET